jgi:hypothetical protein
VLPSPSQVYSEMHAYLSGSGVDGVKVDCQVGGAEGGGGPWGICRK